MKNSRKPTIQDLADSLIAFDRDETDWGDADMEKSLEPITIIDSIVSIQAHINMALRRIDDQETKRILCKALARGEVCKGEFRELCHNRFIKGTNGRMRL